MPHIFTSIESLQERIVGVRELAFDFETSGLDVHNATIAGLGLFLPTTENYFYFNLNQDEDYRHPKINPAELRDALQPFFGDPLNTAYAFNATFDLQFLIYHLGVNVRCRIRDVMIETHRHDSHLRNEGDASTSHPLTHLQYGLKELTTAFFHQRPPHLQDATDGYSTLASDVHEVASYCCVDCYNTWRLHQYNGSLDDIAVSRLLDEIDDRNVLPLTKMVWEGVGVNKAEAERQIEVLSNAATACRDEIWRIVGKHPHLAVRTDVSKFLAQYLGDSSFLRSLNQEHLTFAYANNTGERQQVIALTMMLLRIRQRLSSFLTPLVEKVEHNRIYIEEFSSKTKTTRFSSRPNMQALPKRSDTPERWEKELPPSCRPSFKIRNVIQARPGCSLIELDLKSVEPHYLAELMQQALTRHDSRFIEKRDRLRKEHRDRHPNLTRLMFQTQLEVHYKQPPIKWPSYQKDPLWRVFEQGGDPYNALLMAMDKEGYQEAKAKGKEEEWLAKWRWRGKKCFLALGYGSKAPTLAPKLGWSVEQTKQAIKNLETHYATLNPLRELTRRELFQLGEVETLWGRPYRVNGYYQLAHADRLLVRFHRRLPTPRTYEAQVISMGTYSWGLQCLVLNCWYVHADESHGGCVLQSNENGELLHADMLDVFVRRNYFNTIPFRNIPFSTIDWVREENGLLHNLPRQESAFRMGFNAMCQATGADHIRWLMNNIDNEACGLPSFSDCKLVLSIHDSLIYEVPDQKIDSFLSAIAPIVRRRPPWATLDYDFDATVGKRFGEMLTRARALSYVYVFGVLLLLVAFILLYVFAFYR
jgi:DNA polymerase I-like protein with 3'-5' exonuclease and polymerase domains